MQGYSVVLDQPNREWLLSLYKLASYIKFIGNGYCPYTSWRRISNYIKFSERILSSEP